MGSLTSATRQLQVPAALGSPQRPVLSVDTHLPGISR